jgi:transposase
MEPMKTAPAIILSNAERKTLTKWSRGRSTPARLVLRAKIVLAAAENKTNERIAEELGASKPTVGRWRTRFAALRTAGIEKDASRPGRTSSLSAETVTRIVEKTTRERPEAATHWSTRSMAKVVGVSKDTVRRVWAAHGLKPHLTRNFKLSNDPHFEEKLVDVVGLYLDPPEHALVLCADEKTSIQALDRTQRGLPLHPGRCGTMTRDYKRNGTTTLFAAIEMAEGRLIGTCMSQHRHQEWIKFLKQIDAETPAELDLHLVVDNYATHKHPKVQKWLKRHKRFHIHFTPTSSSWLNLIERWFREITDKRIRRGTFRSAEQLIQAIMDYIQQHNRSPKPFVWTAKADEILAKVQRARKVLDKSQSV